MNRIRLLDLQTVSALRSQTVYHAVAHAMTDETPDTIILVSPQSPYVCAGFHQDIEKEIDLDYCRRHEIPVYRREVGGGAVYLDSGQVFVQWIFHDRHLPADLESRFRLYIEPLVETYRAFGINAYHRPINDIHVDRRKIGGTGAARMGIADVVVGSLMFAFDKKTMAKVLKVSSEKMRDKIFESLEQYMTTVEDQIGKAPPRDAMVATYLSKCAGILGADIVRGSWTPAEQTMAEEWDARFLSEEWLFQRGGLRPDGLKIHEDVRVVESSFKSPGGLIRVTARINEGIIEDLAYSGDFTVFPASSVSALEQAVRGARVAEDSLLPRLAQVYQDLRIQSPGVKVQDFATAISNAIHPRQ